MCYLACYDPYFAAGTHRLIGQASPVQEGAAVATCVAVRDIDSMGV
jgi:hypothetical protein